MEAGITDDVWDVKDLVALLPAIGSKPRGPYKKKGGEKMETVLDDFVISCPCGCGLIMGHPIEEIDGRYFIRLRTEAEKEECRRQLLASLPHETRS
jgi:hypothetical protein